MLELHTSLIKSGGGNGPMKPGNLRKRGAKSGGETKDEDSIDTHVECLDVCFSFWSKLLDRISSCQCRTRSQTDNKEIRSCKLAVVVLLR